MCLEWGFLCMSGGFLCLEGGFLPQFFLEAEAAQISHFSCKFDNKFCSLSPTLNFTLKGGLEKERGGI